MSIPRQDLVRDDVDAPLEAPLALEQGRVVVEFGKAREDRAGDLAVVAGRQGTPLGRGLGEEHQAVEGAVVPHVVGRVARDLDLLAQAEEARDLVEVGVRAVVRDHPPEFVGEVEREAFELASRADLGVDGGGVGHEVDAGDAATPEDVDRDQLARRRRHAAGEMLERPEAVAGDRLERVRIQAHRPATLVIVDADVEQVVERVDDGAAVDVGRVGKLVLAGCRQQRVDEGLVGGVEDGQHLTRQPVPGEHPERLLDVADLPTGARVHEHVLPARR